MAVWQLTKTDAPIVAPLFDDGASALPGEDAFSADAVKGQVAASNGIADGFNYVGQSGV